MDGLGVVETSIIVAIHFQCHGDGPLSIMKSLLWNVGYGTDSDNNTVR